MKKNLLVAALLVSASLTAFGQGTIVFNNRVTPAFTGPQAPVVAPIFDFDPSDPISGKRGNPTATWNGSVGPAPAPLGTQTYGGEPLRGTGYTATLWAANSSKPDSELALIATTTFRTSTTQSLWGFFEPLSGPIVVPDTPSDPAQRAKFQVRVWNNQGYNRQGTILTWEDAVLVFSQGRTAIGSSDIFLVDFQLGGGTLSAPNLIGLQSFELIVPIPEPSVIALAILGGASLLLFRRGRK